MKTSLKVCLVLISVWALQQQAFGQSFGELRRVIQKKYSPDTHQDRIEAASALGQLGDIRTLRFVVARIRKTSKEYRQRLESAKKMTAQIDELDQDIKKARAAGAGNVNQSKVGELAELREDRKRINLSVKHVGLFLETLRRTVGELVDNFPDEERSSALDMMIKAHRKSKDNDDKLVMLRVLVSCDEQEVSAYLNKLVLGKQEVDRLAALVAAEDWGGLRAMRLALICLEDPIWRVRAQSIRILKKVGGKRAVEFLIAALAREDGRLKTDAMVALKYRTGVNYRKNQHLWKKWLDQNHALLSEPTETENAEDPPEQPEEEPEGRRRDPIGGSLDAPRRKAPAGGGTGFYGVETTSKHIVYVLDFSGSMVATGRRGGGRGAGRNDGPIRLNGDRRIDRMAAELVRAVTSLPKTATFNIVTFESKVAIWRKKMVYATKENKLALKQWIQKQQPSGQTNLFGGLEEAFKFAGRGSYDQSYEIAADTIFILSDGSPTAGRLTKPQDIMAEIRKVNTLKRIAIHGIALGRGVGRLLRALANEHDGQFVEIPD